MSIRIALCSVLMIAVAAPRLAASQSFDCDKASTPSERAICDDSRLSQLDNDLAQTVKRELRRHPDQRTQILKEERRWVADRDAHCPAEGQEPESVNLCLIDAYNQRIAAFVPPTPDELEKNTRICKLLVDQYRPLAHEHPSQRPIETLAQVPSSAIKLAPPIQSMDHPGTELASWAAAQNPPFTFSPDLRKSLRAFGSPTLIKAPGVDFYMLTEHQGSMGCTLDLSLVVRKGVAYPAVTPEDSSSDSCGIGPRFLTFAGQPLAVEESYDWRPGMKAKLDVWTWNGREFSQGCEILLTYKPLFTSKTFNNWDESCKGDDCDALRKAASSLAESAESDADGLRARSLESLTEPQQQQFEVMESEFEALPRASNDRFSIPCVHDGQLYLASIGHHAIGWRDYADWSVVFAAFNGTKMTRRVELLVGVEKGDLENVSITDTPYSNATWWQVTNAHSSSH